MSNPYNRQCPVLLRQGRGHRLELGQNFVAGSKMIKRQIEGGGHDQKPFRRQFFQHVSVGNVGCLPDNRTAKKVNDSSWLRIGNIKVVHSWYFGGTEHPISVKVFPLSNDSGIFFSAVGGCRNGLGCLWWRRCCIGSRICGRLCWLRRPNGGRHLCALAFYLCRRGSLEEWRARCETIIAWSKR